MALKRPLDLKLLHILKKKVCRICYCGCQNNNNLNIIIIIIISRWKIHTNGNGTNFGSRAAEFHVERFQIKVNI